MSEFLTRANKIQEEREASAKKIEDDKKEYYNGIISRLQLEFEAGFVEYLPILKSDGIEYSLHLQDARYEYMGAYVSFKKGSKELRMDFYNQYSYRYIYTPYLSAPSMAYSKWPKEDFVLFIADNLLRE